MSARCDRGDEVFRMPILRLIIIFHMRQITVDGVIGYVSE